MSFLRPMSMLRSAALRPAALSAAHRAGLQVRFATTDYGSGDGNPAGEKPQDQGKNASENLEHPGPPPPKVAEGKSSSSPNDDKSSANNSTQKPSSSSSSSKNSPSGKREFSTSTRRWAESKEPAVKQGQQNKPSQSEMKDAKPKILSDNPPAKEDESEDVKKHNEEMDNRAEQAHEKIANEDAAKDKVSSDFWKGEGGRGGSEGVKG
ncbi:Nn.00g089930.m01.CDS01 [Neocucurbitaria sp. VM-36]